MENTQNVGRGLIEPEVVMLDLPPTHPRSSFQIAVRNLTTVKVCGKDQRRGDYSISCVELYKAGIEAFGENFKDVITDKKLFTLLIGRKNRRKYMTWNNAYDANFNKCNTIVRAIVNALAAGNGHEAQYQLGNIRGAAGEVNMTTLSCALEAKDGVEAEEAVNRLRAFTKNVYLPIRLRKHFINAIQLLCLDWLQTQVALSALGEFNWTYED